VSLNCSAGAKNVVQPVTFRAANHRLLVDSEYAAGYLDITVSWCRAIAS